MLTLNSVSSEPAAGHDAGLHLEMQGNFTLTYQRLISFLSQEPFTGPTFYKNSADPFEYLVSHAVELGISVYERMEIWPHFLHKYFPSYLAWRVERGSTHETGIIRAGTPQ